LYRKVENSSDPDARETMFPIFSALLAEHRQESEKAAEMVRGTKRYDLRFNYFLAYVRGLVFLAAQKASEAEPDFQKVLEHRGLVWNSPPGALAHLQLGRAYAMKGDTAKARSAYEDFLTLWKDADPDIPILKQAKAEYAKLQ